MIENLPIKEYHNRGEISSSILKAVTISSAHLERMLNKKSVPNKAMILGDAVHAAILEPKRFNKMYEERAEFYKKRTGEHVAGEPKRDDEGDQIRMLESKEDSKFDLKNEEYKKFQAMMKAYNESEEAKALVKSAKYIEVSFFYDRFRVRPDFITSDGWIVDLKTVGGTKEKPSSPENFGRDFFDMGYDIQMYMYYNLVKKELPEIKGFKFLCLDAKVPSGVQIYTFVNGESKWFELGGYRFHNAVKLYDSYLEERVHKVYDNESPDDLPLSYQAEDYLVRARNE